MKRFLILLAALLLPTLALADSFSFFPLQTVTPTPVRVPTPTPAADSIRAQMSYDDSVEWAQAEFGYVDTDSAEYLLYDPIYIDPVAYFHWINTDHGVRDGELHIVQFGRTDRQVQSYLDHLTNFGYTCQTTAFDADSTFHTLTLSSRHAGTSVIPPVIRVEYRPAMQLLLVRYEHAYGAVNRVWRNREMTGDIPALPASLRSADGARYAVTLHSALLTDSAECLNIPLSHPLYSAEDEFLHDQGIFMCISDDDFDAEVLKDESHWASYDDAYIMAVELELNGTLLNPDRCFLVERAPEEGVVLNKPILWGAMTEGTEASITLDMSQHADRLWVVFTVQRCEPDMPLRLYMDVSGQSAGSPMETWACVDFMPPKIP